MSPALFIALNLVSFVISTPDFIVDQTSLTNLKISVEYIPEGDCQFLEGCVSGYGERVLARFDTSVANIGTSAFILGDPTTNPNTVYDPCHQHYHYSEWVEYQVFAEDDTLQQQTLIDGFKQGFCLMDIAPYPDYPGNKSLISPVAQYDCSHQGVSVGWMDVYPEHITCQFVDITEFEAGTYTLKAIVNPNNAVTELDTTNNEASTTFEYNGNLASYYWSNYIPNKSDVKTWKDAMNSLLEDIEDTTDTEAAIFTLFESGALCFNPGGCLDGPWLSGFWYAFDATLDQFKFKIDKDSVIYGTGYWFARAEWTMKSKSGCKFKKSDTTINVYYREDGSMDRTRLTSEENGAMELFLFDVVFGGFAGTPVICRKGYEYLSTGDVGEEDVSSEEVLSLPNEYVHNKDHTGFVRNDQFKDFMGNVYELAPIPIIAILVIVVCACSWMNRKKTTITYEKVNV